MRWLNQCLKPSFAKTGLDFNVEYITTVRNWVDSLAAFSSLSGAYKKRKANEEKEIPHSFTFARRDSVKAIRVSRFFVRLLFLGFGKLCLGCFGFFV